MLFHFKLFAKQGDADKKQIDGHGYPFIGYYLLPRLFHFGTPVYVIKHDHAVLMQMRVSLFEIPNGWFVAMIAINVQQIDGR